MADSESVFEFIEQRFGFFFGDAVGGFAAIGGDEVILFWVELEQARYVRAVALFENFEDVGFVSCPLVGIGATKVFVNPTLPVDSHFGADAIF